MYLFYFIVIVVLALGNAKAQERPKAVLAEEVGITCSEDLMARYDYFLGKLLLQPSARGMLLFYGDQSSEGRNLNLFRWMTEFYPQVRRFKNLNLEFVRAKNGPKTNIQFWIVPSGAEPPAPSERFQPEAITSTSRYDVAAADFHKYKGKTYLYLDGFYELGCDFAPNNVGFVDQLRKNKSLTGYFVVYTEFGKGKAYGDRIARFAVSELLKNFRISRARIKTIYGGNRNKPEIELWLVPEGDRLPTLLPDKEPSFK